tara:strand:+ start:171 stop:350 length:180 start_codon:yes stop_codon:yes gene_type:complete
MSKIETQLDSMMHQLDMAIEQGMKDIEEYDMCQACKDAVAVDRARGYRVCRDCYYEMGV